MSNRALINFGQNILKLMRYHDMTYAELEKATGIGAASLNEYVHCKHRMSLDKACIIAKAFNTTIDEMIVPIYDLPNNRTDKG